MGMYTELTLDATLTDHGMALVNEVHRLGASNPHIMDEWKRAADSIGGFEIDVFANLPRSGMIPFGGSAYFDDTEWKVDDEGRRYTFRCNLKNYDNEIDTFIRVVLPQIAETVHACTKWYEEEDGPTDYLPVVREAIETWNHARGRE